MWDRCVRQDFPTGHNSPNVFVANKGLSVGRQGRSLPRQNLFPMATGGEGYHLEMEKDGDAQRRHLSRQTVGLSLK